MPKTSQPQTCQQFKPISVTPILSRIMEKLLSVGFFTLFCVITPCFSLLVSQFAFRPSGSTTSALIFLLHQLTNLLEKHDYVPLIALDFSKAFDTVRHISLLQKMADFPLPDNVYCRADTLLTSLSGVRNGALSNCSGSCPAVIYVRITVSCRSCSGSVCVRAEKSDAVYEHFVLTRRLYTVMYNTQ